MALACSSLIGMGAPESDIVVLTPRLSRAPRMSP
jgi:hypothetical protein